jgi:PAS domain S-box-containing protein
MSSFSSRDGFYGRLHQAWRQINETHSLQDIAHLALQFAVGELGFDRAVLFIHDDETGLFKARFHQGYTEPGDAQKLKIIQLLLSGEIVQTLRESHEPIIHTAHASMEMVSPLMQALGLGEAVLALFAGDVEVPHGIIVVGNALMDPHKDLHSTVSVSDARVLVALENLIVHLSNAVNTSMFYRAWGQEKQFLKENIALRTQEILDQKQQFEAIYQSSKDGIAVLDVHTSAFLDANPAYLEMTGLTRTELLRTSCLALTVPEDVPANRAAVEEVCRKGFVRDFVKSCTVKNGRRITVNMSMALMHGGQQILVTTKDMTQRYALEQDLLEAKNRAVAVQNQLVEKNRALEDLAANLETMVAARTEELARALLLAQEAARAKSEFLATMSHEIRTPMNGVLGMTELLGSTELSEDQRQLLRMLQSSGQSLMTIINDILDFSKIEAGKLDLEHVPFNLPELFLELKEVFSVQASSRDLALSWDWPAHLPMVVQGDTTRLKQVFSNLIANAIKFTHQGEVSISVVPTEVPDVYQASIRDTGIGMSPQVQAKLFNAFTQANASTTRQYGGSGLGLVISATLVQLMRGRIWVDSAVDQGSTFHFTFWAPQIKQAPVVEPVKPVLSQDMSYLRVLVVEDHHVNRLLVVKFLQNLGIQADVAHDGLQALQCLASAVYDVVLMDIQMPNMDGLTAAQHIRANDHWHQPCIIALTANAFAEDRAVCQAAGMDQFLSKPVSMSRLIEALNQVPIVHAMVRPVPAVLPAPLAVAVVPALHVQV